MKDFATESRPLRASGLPNLVLCLWREVAREMRLTENESGKAADTGSAVHLAVAKWHENKDLVESVAAMRRATAAFPLADMDEAERIFGRYAADPRNQNAQVVASEIKVRVSIDPKFIDGPPIWIQGTADQVRWNPFENRHEVWDLKTGTRDAMYFQNVYPLQLAAYTLALRATYPDVVAGGYIRSKGYFTRGADLPAPHGVFIPANILDPDALLDAVRWAVCAIRSGYIIATPGEHCQNCWFGSQEMCLSKLKGVSNGS